MGIFERMNRLTKGEPEIEVTEPAAKASVGDIIQGIITNVIHRGPKNKKDGFGFIASPALPYERIFFHWSGLRQDTLRFPQIEKKMKVEFMLQFSETSYNPDGSIKHEGGYRAIKIKVLDNKN